MLKYMFAGLALVTLSACVNQSEMALANNVYKLDLDARGLIAVNEAKNSAQRRAAELTLSKGFTHYLIADARSSDRTLVVGSTPMYGNTTVNVLGNTAYGRTNIYGGQPIVQPRSNTSLIIAMYKAPDIPPNAIDARTIATEAKK